MFQTLNVRKISVSTEWAMSCGQDIKLHIYSVSTHKWTSDKVQLTLTFYVSKFFFFKLSNKNMKTGDNLPTHFLNKYLRLLNVY